MERTIEDLEKLLVERALVGRMLREEPGTDPGADYLITDTDFFPLSMLAVLKFDTDDCAFTLKDLGKLLDGQKVRGMGKRWNKAYTLLPLEGEEPTEEEPATEPAVPTEEEPATEPAVPTEQPAKGEDLIPTSLKGVESGSVEEWIRKNYGGRPFNDLARNIAEKDLMDAFKADCGLKDTEEEPTPEPAVPTEQPAKPKLSRAWVGRWWQAYWHYLSNEEVYHNAAVMADEAVAYAMKHLEGD